MYLSSWSDADFQQSAMEDVDMLKDNMFKKSDLTNTLHSKHGVAIGDSEDTWNSLAGALSELPPRYRSREPSFPKTHGPIHNVPVEILLRIFRLIALPCTRESLYALSELTHVCQFWRMALINQPRVWSTVFVTQRDCRSFVEACLERSHPAPLDVTVDAGEVVRAYPGCTCDKDNRKRLLPNEMDPCEWHFQFESLAEPKYSNRIHTLDMDLDGEWIPAEKMEQFALGSCRFFTSSFPQLVTLRWKNEKTDHANYLFPTLPSPLTLRSLTYVGAWSTFFAPVNNLTSFVFESSCGPDGTSVEAIRLFVSNNPSLESLEFKYVDFEGDPGGPPVHLLNLKSLNIGIPYKELSTIIRVPALNRLSSLRISLQHNPYTYMLRATGDGIAFSARCLPHQFGETWEDFTGYARPAIHHIRLEDGLNGNCGERIPLLPLLSDVHTLEIGKGCFPFWYHGFLDDLKQLGPQLKVIRFGISGELEPFRGSSEYEVCGGLFLDRIEELVKYRFGQGHPFSVIERMVAGGSEQTNRQEDYVWRCFYGSRRLSQYVRPI